MSTPTRELPIWDSLVKRVVAFVTGILAACANSGTNSGNRATVVIVANLFRFLVLVMIDDYCGNRFFRLFQELVPYEELPSPKVLLKMFTSPQIDRKTKNPIRLYMR